MGWIGFQEVCEYVHRCKVFRNRIVNVFCDFMRYIRRCVIFSICLPNPLSSDYSTSRKPIILSLKFRVSSTNWSDQTSCRNAQLRRWRVVDISMGSREPEAFRFLSHKGVFMCIYRKMESHMLFIAIHYNLLLHTKQSNAYNIVIEILQCLPSRFCSPQGK